MFAHALSRERPNWAEFASRERQLCCRNSASLGDIANLMQAPVDASASMRCGDQSSAGPIFTEISSSPNSASSAISEGSISIDAGGNVTRTVAS